MQFFPADYVVLGCAAVAAVFGLFGGLSGALAMLAGTVGASVASRVAWSYSVSWFDASWARALASFGIALVAFGIARKVVRVLVHKLLAQPGDAIFGAIVAAASGFALALAAAYLLTVSGILEVDSRLLDCVTALWEVRE